MNTERDLAVGISDLLARRECPRRAAYGARRHTGEGQQDHAARTPESRSPATSYGSAIHDAIEHVENGHTDDVAVELAWAKWGAWLEPSDITLLKEDLAKYRDRDFVNVRTVLSEGEIKVPLTTMPDGRQIYFRARIDRLYERLDAPGQFIHIDYKSSKWQKSQDEVDNDPQLWAYNWVIYEYFPEVEGLEQWMDQLRHGMVPTGKSDAKREEIREWLSIEARAYFAEPELMDDGLPGPRFNDWCPWCAILESCAIVPQLSEWALMRIDELRPPDMSELPSVTPIDTYVERYDAALTAMKVLERYTDSVKALVREMPAEDSQRIGFRLTERRNSVVPARGMEELLERLGPRRFLNLVKVTQERLKSIEDEETREWALGLVEKVPGAKVVNRTRR